MASQALATQEQSQQRSLITEMAGQYGVEPAKFIEAIKKTVFPSNVQATNEQLLAFLVVAKTYNLNPFTRELYAFPANGGIVPIISIDGRISMTQRHDKYDGCEFIDHRDNGKLIAVTCRMFRKDRSHPVEVTEYLEECKHQTDPWTKMPQRMLRHKAFIQASRYAFGFSGLYDEDEAQDIITADPIIPGHMEMEKPIAAAPQTPQTPQPTLYFCVGQKSTVISGATEKLDLKEMKKLSLKVENRQFVIPAALTEEFLKLCDQKNVTAIQIDEKGEQVKPYEAAESDLPATMFEDPA